MRKHRDYLHAGVGDHLADNSTGGTLVDKLDDEPVMIPIDPITGEEFDNPHPYYVLPLTLSGKLYKFLIPSEGGDKPNLDAIKKSLNAYMKKKPSTLRELRLSLVQQYVDGEEVDNDLWLD